MREENVLHVEGSSNRRALNVRRVSVIQEYIDSLYEERQERKEMHYEEFDAIDEVVR